MKLLMRRDQRSGVLGKQIFSLEVRADLTPDEKGHIKKYKLGETVLYQKYKTDNLPPLPGVSGFIAGVLTTFDQLVIAVRDLEAGKKVECKDVVEMIAIENVIREAAKNFKAVLDVAAKFGGEEVLEL